MIRRQARVDLDQVNGHQAARLVHALADEVALSQGQAPAHRRSRARSPHGVEGVHVKGQVDRGVVANVCERHLDDAADSVPVDIYRGQLRETRKKGEGE